ncbi:uncharacterized protein [Nicotiana tomentosiformis]|uniref:uncharacterized protein n=1 Tax=Nicotiana tomentosiformis TaxID=4098 RepID=UPI00051B95A6|nr:microtubule-associated protein RP/EB family member 1-like [Nicotiana tomentosiformis]
MPKATQMPSKAKSSTKVEAKPQILNSKSKKNAQPSREPTPTPSSSPSISSTIPISSSPTPTGHVVPIIPSSIVSPPPKITTHAPELLAKNTSKSTKVKATPRKSVKKVPDAATQGDTVAKESVVQGESVKVTIGQVKYPPSKLDILVSAIDVPPLNAIPPMSEKPLVEKFTLESGVRDLVKETGDEDRGEKEEEVVNSLEEHDAQNIANEEEKSENEGASGDEKESDTKDNTGEHANDSAEDENQSEEEEVFESEGEDQEKVSESEGGDEESEEEEEGNMSEESEGSMTIGNTVIAPSGDIGKETRSQEPRSRLTPSLKMKKLAMMKMMCHYLR